jgi:hypothetical protein
LIVPEENPAGVVYGLVVIGALLAAESGRHETYLATVASAGIAAALYWLAHAYATVLGRRLSFGQRLNLVALARALAHDWALVRGAAIPLLTTLVAWLLGASQETAVAAALWSDVVAIAVLELAAGLRSRGGAAELALQACVSATLGAGIIVLRVVLHP